LDRAEIGLPECADRTGAPGLGGDPGDQIGPVGRFLGEGVEGALGGVAATDLLYHHRVASTQRAEQVQVIAKAGYPVLVVRGSCDQGRRLPVGGPVVVGGQQDAVPHRYGHAGLHRESAHDHPPF
jgi:hypothetical protein